MTTSSMPVRASRDRRSVALLPLVAVAVPCAAAALGGALLVAGRVTVLDGVLLAVGYTLTLLGVEGGFHRMVAHGAFRARPRLARTLIVLGSMAAQGPVLFWAATHRRHHAHADDDGDPHAPTRRGPGWRGALAGLMHAHFTWLLFPQATDWARYAPDLVRDPTLFRLHRSYPAWVALGMALPAAIGGMVGGSLAAAATGFLWGGPIRIFLVHQAVWSVNSIAHRSGRRPFHTGDTSGNVAWLALPTLGGAWHNNHHAFPAAADNRLQGWEVDPCGWFVRRAHALGWVESMNVPGTERLAARRRSAPTADPTSPAGGVDHA